MSYTEGPWTTNMEDITTYQINCRLGQVAEAYGKENARLISKAPELLYWLKATLEWIDAVPDDTQLPAMPGFDRDIVDGLIDEIEGGE